MQFRVARFEWRGKAGFRAWEEQVLGPGKSGTVVLRLYGKSFEILGSSNEKEQKLESQLGLGEPAGP